jgi:hypothetical protein
VSPEAGRPSFLKKRSKRLLWFGLALGRNTRTKAQKFFDSFFKKERFCLACPSRQC